MNALSTPVAADAATTSLFSVPGMHCAACIARIENGLRATPGILDARVNFTAKRVRIEHLPELDPADLRTVIERIGFSAEPFTAETEGDAGRETRKLATALAVAGFAAMNIMLLSVSVWSGAEGATRQLFHWLSALIALPTVAYAGRPFFRSAWGALRHGRTNMDVPISIGVILATGMSLFETITHGRHAYFDGAVMLLFFLLAGRLLDSVMRARAEDGVAALMRRTPAGALVMGADGTSAWRATEELAPGMRILIAAGERVAADGVVEAGASSLDRSLITGESAPQAAIVGDMVLAGTINLEGPLTVRIKATGDRTVIADIARAMEAAAQGKSRYVRIADRAARLYAPAVHTLAAASFLGWMIAGAGWHQALLIAVAVLIITCPCALGLAVPVAQVVAVGALMRRNVLVKDGSALERLAGADLALLDKTGTITLGRPAPIGALALADTDKPVALALARASHHPLSRALAAALEREGVTAIEPDMIAEHPGLGIEATVAGAVWRLGRADWLGCTDPVPDGAIATAFGRVGGTPVLLPFADALRPGAEGALRRLEREGLMPVMLSGDTPAAVRAVAKTLRIAGKAGFSPKDKLAYIEHLQWQGHRVLMVGDGLNDGPALKAAYVSMAPSSATDVGRTAADLLFLGESLMPVPIAIAAARRTMRVVRQNFALAIGYNALAVPLAISGLVTPLIAALAMSGSSLIVVANALRLRNAAR
jgi:Cu2+-exporting ATPase